MIEKRVGIFICYEWLSVSPSLVSTIHFLTENGYFVDVVYLYDELFGIFEPESDKVKAIAVKSTKRKYLSLLRFLAISLKNVIKHRYGFFIGVDQEGVIVSGILSKIKKNPNIYYSLEILTKEDIAKEKGLRKFFLTIRKLLENYFSKNANLTIVQDIYRAKVLIEDNGIDKNRIFIVPNSYYFTPQKPRDSTSFDFQTSTDKKIIIYTGSIIPEMAIEDIISYIDLWPQNTILILHTPYRTNYLEKIEQLIRRKNLEQKIIISVKQLSFEELCALLKKADIGLSFYRPINKSFALSPSGKISFYLSQGLPFITNKIPSAVDLVSKYKCGICVDKIEEVGEAISKILENYSEFSANTKICYENELEFSKFFKKILDYYEKKHF